MVSNAQDEYYFSTELYSREREHRYTGILTLKEKAKCRGCIRERGNTTPPPRLWYRKIQNNLNKEINEMNKAKINKSITVKGKANIFLIIKINNTNFTLKNHTQAMDTAWAVGGYSIVVFHT